MVQVDGLRVEVEDYVATAYRDGERIGQWQAGVREYAAAGVEWPGCSCGEESCRHGLAHYWGEALSPAALDALAATRVTAGHPAGNAGGRAPRPAHHHGNGETEMSMAPEIRITTIGHSGECQECGRIDHSGPLALVHERSVGPDARVRETYIGECCQGRLVREYHEQAERGEIEFVDARTTGPEL